MERRDLDPEAITRAADVAADYEALQGLTTMLIGGALLFMGLSDNIAIGSVFLACSAAIGQGHYYKKYGKASTQPSNLWTTVAFVLIWVFATFIGLMIDRWAGIPIAMGTLICGLTLVPFDKAQYRHVGTTRIHWAVIGGLVVSSLVPLITGWGSPDWLWRYSVTVIGAALVIRGLVDHLRLTKALAPSDGPPEAGGAPSQVEEDRRNG
ncbi:MAG: hypothetical protein ACTH2Q_03015 [Propionibacteriaceae bacterium]